MAKDWLRAKRCQSSFLFVRATRATGTRNRNAQPERATGTRNRNAQLKRAGSPL
jgi:hypothetical protein